MAGTSSGTSGGGDPSGATPGDARHQLSGLVPNPRTLRCPAGHHIPYARIEQLGESGVLDCLHQTPGDEQRCGRELYAVKLFRPEMDENERRKFWLYVFALESTDRLELERAWLAIDKVFERFGRVYTPPRSPQLHERFRGQPHRRRSA